VPAVEPIAAPAHRLVGTLDRLKDTAARQKCRKVNTAKAKPSPPLSSP